MAMAKVAIIGSGNIGTDLMIKAACARSEAARDGRLRRHRSRQSDGLKRAQRAWACRPLTEGIEGLLADAEFDEIQIVFDATQCRRARSATAQLAAGVLASR
jgi:acetaldehyde dehydrogenase